MVSVDGNVENDDVCCHVTFLYYCICVSYFILNYPRCAIW